MPASRMTSSVAPSASQLSRPALFVLTLPRRTPISSIRPASLFRAPLVLHHRPAAGDSASFPAARSLCLFHSPFRLFASAGHLAMDGDVLRWSDRIARAPAIVRRRHKGARNFFSCLLTVSCRSLPSCHRSKPQSTRQLTNDNSAFVLFGKNNRKSTTTTGGSATW